MATIDFLTLDKLSGSGNGTVTVTAPKRTDKGRGARSVKLKISAVNSAVEVSKIVTVQQAGEAIQIFEFGPGGSRPGDNAIQLDGTKAVTYSDTGETNSGRFYVWVKRVTSLYDEDISSGEAVTTGVRVVHHYTNEQFTIKHEGNGLYAVDSEYGFDSSYRFVVEVDLPANPTTAINYYRISVCTNSTPEESDTIYHSFGRQSAGMAKLTVSPETLSLAYGGSSGNFTITSNDAWIVEQVDGEEEPEPGLTKLPTPELNATIFGPKSAQLTIRNAGHAGGVNNIEIILSPDHGSLSSVGGGLIWNVAGLTPSTQYVVKARFKGDGVTTLDSEWATVTFTTTAEQGSEEPELGDTGDISVYGFKEATNDQAFTKGSAINLSASKLNGLGNQIVFFVELITKSRILNIASSDFSVFEAGILPYAYALSSELLASAIEAGQDLSMVSDVDMVQITGSYDSTSASLTIPDTVQPDSEGRFVVFVAFGSNHAWSSSTQNASITFETDNSEAVASIRIN